jgi:branched-chain amino acid transport system substrate-binding protein
MLKASGSGNCSVPNTLAPSNPIGGFMSLPKFIALALCAGLSGTAHAAATIKLAFLDPLSGPFANVGELGLKHLQHAVDEVNARGGVKFEIISFDSKANAQESLVMFKQITDRGIPFVIQGNSSAVAGALVDAVAKHNQRSPEQPIVYLNYGAVDPALTNDKCTFTHFRFDAHVDMKMEGLTNHLKLNPAIKKVYLINQDYAFGHAFRKAAVEMLGRKRPDIKIVGDDLHPLGKVKDFAPYVAKIKAAGADTVLTGNWGADIQLLIKAGKDAGMKVNWYTYYIGTGGSITAIGDAGVDVVKQITAWHPNIDRNLAETRAVEFEKKYKIDYYWHSVPTMVEMLAIAATKANSEHPLKIARALEGLKFDSVTGEVMMRADDHQLIMPLYVSTLTKADGKKIKYDQENTGYGFKTDARLELKDVILPTSCRMKRL